MTERFTLKPMNDGLDKLFSTAINDAAPVDVLELQAAQVRHVVRLLEQIAGHYARTGLVPAEGALTSSPEEGEKAKNYFAEMAASLSVCAHTVEKIVKDSRAARPGLTLKARSIHCNSEGVCADGAKFHALMHCLEACRSGDAETVNGMYGRLDDLNHQVQSLRACLYELSERRSADAAGTIARKGDYLQATLLTDALSSLCISLDFARRRAAWELNRVRAANHGRLP